jgi:hypothetical protein
MVTVHNSRYYDATILELDTDGTPDAAPHSMSQILGWTLTNYSSKVIDAAQSPTCPSSPYAVTWLVVK